MRRQETLEVYEKIYTGLGICIAESTNVLRNFLVIESVVDGNPDGEWVVEFCLREGVSDAPRKWRYILGEAERFDFDVANKVLCNLVEFDCIAVEDYRDASYQEREKLRERYPHIGFEGMDHGFEKMASSGKVPVTFGHYADKKARVYTLRFDPNTAHYRIRNIYTGEEVYGDAL
ncbi:MAG: hypothetical protein MN733_11880 [Nitrososphaera sp.]|nr:hypothetical protein [Nitrososphaera sp.]